MNVLSLFSGIGGLELGLERAGMTVVGQVEIDEYCRRVLAKHWPEVPRHDDVRTCVEWWQSEPRPRVDLVCGGFPCQPFSQAGLRIGMDDDRWLWPPMFDVVRELRPRYVLVENVPGLIDAAAAFGTILAGLSELGFDADWSTLTACTVGAPHMRRRLFLVAYPAGGDVSGDLPHRPESQSGYGHKSRRGRSGTWRHGWLPESSVDRVAHGLPRRVVRPALEALGSAVVPQVAEHVGRLILDADALTRAGP